jgi:hypothetical protein
MSPSLSARKTKTEEGDRIMQEHERLPENRAQVDSVSDPDGAFVEAESAIAHHQHENLGLDQLVHRFPLFNAFTPQQSRYLIISWSSFYIMKWFSSSRSSSSCCSRSN